MPPKRASYTFLDALNQKGLEAQESALTTKYMVRRKVPDPVLSNPTVNNYARNFSSQNCRMEKKYGQCTRQSCRHRHKRPRAPRESSRDHNGRRGGAEPSGKGDFDDKRQVAMVNFVDQEPFENVEYIAEDEYLAELEV